jgi:hypothetical protein
MKEKTLIVTPPALLVAAIRAADRHADSEDAFAISTREQYSRRIGGSGLQAFGSRHQDPVLSVLGRQGGDEARRRSYFKMIGEVASDSAGSGWSIGR